MIFIIVYTLNIYKISHLLAKDFIMKRNLSSLEILLIGTILLVSVLLSTIF